MSTTPASLEQQLQQAKELRSQDNYEGAADIYRETISAHPDRPDLHYFLGMTLWHLQQNKAAREHIQKAFDAGFSDADAWYNYGLLLQELGDGVNAIQAYQSALKLKPDITDANNNIATLLIAEGKRESAISFLREELKINPDDPETYVNLGQILRMEKRLEEAESSFQAAIRLQPHFLLAHYRLAQVYVGQKQFRKALDVYLEVLQQDDAGGFYWQAFVTTLNLLDDIPKDARLIDRLEQCYSRTDLGWQHLAKPTTILLESNRELKRMYRDAESGALYDQLSNGEYDSLLASSLLIKYLKQTVSINIKLETILARLRKLCLEMVCDDRDTLGKHLVNDSAEFISALACQCFNNEYVFFTSPEEQSLAEKTGEAICSAVTSDKIEISDVLLNRIIVYAMYQPLATLACHHQLAENKTAFPDFIGDMIQKQIEAPLIEQEIRDNIPTLGSIKDDNSRKVGEINESAPYPRWLSINRVSARPIQDVFQDMFPWYVAPFDDTNETDILIAGCGTGDHAIAVAQQYTNSKILAVDLSRNSLAYAARMAQQLGITNIEFAQADLCNMELDRKFHIIEIVGVLHHMPYETAQDVLQVMHRHLVPKGLIKIGVYSKAARKKLEGIRQLIQAQHYADDPGGVRQARHYLLEQGKNNDLQGNIEQLTWIPDFFSLSEARYLLFDAADHAFDLAMVDTMLQKLQLDFLGFVGMPWQIIEQYKKRFPDDRKRNDMTSWQQFEAGQDMPLVQSYEFWCQAT